MADSLNGRPHVVILASAWGSNWGERGMATRLLGGAVALRAKVSVVSLDPPGSGHPPLRADGIFDVHSVVAPSPDRRLTPLLRASLALQPGGVVPDVASRGLLQLESQPSSDAVMTVDRLAPDVVVLAGVGSLWMAEALPVGAERPRVVALPLAGDDPLLVTPVFGPLLRQTDSLIAFSSVESALLAQAVASAGSERPDARHLRLPLPVNREAAMSGLAGVASFSPYVVFMSGFPEDDPATGVCPPHEYLTQVLGVSVAEIRHGRWVISDATRRHEIVFSPNRMNAWRLIARSYGFVDLRPGGPIGRETVESLRLGIPVVVAEGTVAAEHAAASNGGLWYRQPGEMLDAARALVSSETLRSSLGESGRAWAEATHVDTAGFVSAVQELVLGPAHGRSSTPDGSSSSATTPSRMSDSETSASS